MSPQTVLLRTTLTRTIILHRLMIWPLSSNHLQCAKYARKEVSSIRMTKCRTYTTGNYGTVLRRGLYLFIFARRNIERPRKLCLQGMFLSQPVSTWDTPHLQERACPPLLHCPHEGIVAAIWNMSQRQSRLRRRVAGAVWFPWSWLVYFTLFYLVARPSPMNTSHLRNQIWG